MTNVTLSSNGRYHAHKKVRLITRDCLDRRSTAFREFVAIADGVIADLGGENNISTVQKHLVEAFAGAALNMHDLNSRLMLGEKIDVTEHSQALSSLVRLGWHPDWARGA